MVYRVGWTINTRPFPIRSGGTLPYSQGRPGLAFNSGPGAHGTIWGTRGMSGGHFPLCRVPPRWVGATWGSTRSGGQHSPWQAPVLPQKPVPLYLPIPLASSSSPPSPGHSSVIPPWLALEGTGTRPPCGDALSMCQKAERPLGSSTGEKLWCQGLCLPQLQALPVPGVSKPWPLGP